MAAHSQDFRLGSDESPNRGIERILVGRIDHAARQLAGGEQDPHTAVHEVRKDLKKLRATLRLVRADIGSRRSRELDTQLRDLGRLLGAPRERAVLLETLAELPSGLGLETYRAELERQRTTGPLPIVDLEGLGRDLRAVSLRRNGWSLVEPGLADAYARGRKRLGALRAQPSSERVHALRKRAKDVSYHLRILRPLWPAVLRAAEADIRELTELLGRHHDLAVLDADVQARPELLDPREYAALGPVIAERQAELLVAALPLAELAFAEPAAAYTRRLHRYWRAWRRAPTTG